jgi:hypothetical protein
MHNFEEAPKVIYVQGEDPSDDAEEDNISMEGEQDFEPMPVMKKRKFEEDQNET